MNNKGIDKFDHDVHDSTKKKKSRHKQHLKNTRKKWAKRSGFITLALIIGFGAYFIGQIWGAFIKGHDNIGGSDLRDKEIDINKDPFTVLLMGTDQFDANDEEEEMRTDVLMVAAINPDTNSVKILSIPRDLYTEIANTDGFKTKINSSSYWGKQKGVNPVKNTMETVETFLEVPIDYYAKINFKGFIDIVDAVGGVDVNVKRSFRISTFGNKVIEFKEGPMHLDGEKALPYVRMRKQDPLGDQGRNLRQQEVVSQLMEKLVSFNSVTKFNQITDAVGNNLTYSIPPSEFLSLSKIYQNIPKEKIETVNLDARPEYIKGISYLTVIDEEKQRIREIFRQQLGLPTEDNTDIDDSYDEEANRPHGNG